MTKTDVIIIGSGPGGYRTAEYAAKNGLEVTIIEENEPGGTCLNCGCIPTKTFCKHAELIDQLQEGETYGLKNLHYDIDFHQIMERKQQVVLQLREGVRTLLSSPNIHLVKGKAQFKDKNTVIANDEEYSAPHIIIATGSHAKMPPVEGIDIPGVITSTEMLDIDHVPQELCIIGAGVIGMEFASIFHSFGSKVTVIEFLKECIPTLDSDIAKRLRKTLEHKGIEFHLQSGVQKIERSGQRLTVTFEKKGKILSLDADTVLVATGRGANIDGLGLDIIGVNYDKKGIIVDENMSTNVDGIYAIGDVNGKMMLAHVATFQGFRAINAILGKKDHIRFDIIPSAIFTNPEAASVGKSEQQCKDLSIPYVCHKGYYRSNGKALAMNATEGMVKLLTDTDDKIIGCHIYGAHAADLVQEIAALMNEDIKLTELGQIIHTHPTLEEILQDIAL